MAGGLTEAEREAERAIRRAHGRRLVVARLACDLTQRELADALTCAGFPTTDRAVSQWEKGHTAPSPRRRVAIADMLDQDVAELFSLDDIEGAA